MSLWIEWLGYIASFIILISLLMRSIKRLRYVNLIGAIIFALYGFFINAYPVMLMNAGIVLINIYYLKQIFATKDYFNILPVKENEEYAKALIDFHRKDIENFMPLKENLIKTAEFRFLILRNMNPAGIFLAKRYDTETLEITLDYATPEFQDFKTGSYIYKQNRQTFQNAGYKKFIAQSKGVSHQKYLEKMGFKPTTMNQKDYYIKPI